MFKFSKSGFSLAELMVVLLLVSLLVTALIPIVTKKHLNLPKRSEHGSYLCYYKDGKLYEMKTANKYDGSASAPKEVANCVFTPPVKALYFQISAVGGGGGGGDAGYRGGNYHSSWSDTQRLEPWGLTEEKLKGIHVIYKGNGYFPKESDTSDFTVVQDLSGELYTYARSGDSSKGGDIGYVYCHAGNSFNKRYSPSGSGSWSLGGCARECPVEFCKKNESGNPITKTCIFDYGYYAKPGSDTATKKVCTGGYENKSGTTTVPESKTCTEYKTKEVKEYYCIDGGRIYNVSTTPKSADACGKNGRGSRTSLVETGECKTWNTVPAHEVTTTVKECKGWGTETYSVNNSAPTWKPGSGSYSCCDCEEGKSKTNAACEAARKKLADELAKGAAWKSYSWCYPGANFNVSYGTGLYTGSGGAAGSGVTCKSDAVTNPYGNTLGEKEDFVIHGGTNGGNKIPSAGTNHYPPSNSADKGGDGTISCKDNTQNNSCLSGADWSNVRYASLYITDKSGNKHMAKAYSAPSSGKGGSLKNISMSGNVTSSSWRGNSGVKLREDPDTANICSGESPASTCDTGTSANNVVVGDDGMNGKCVNAAGTSVSAASPGFCGIPTSNYINTAYCLKHHSEYIEGYDRSGNAVVVNQFEPGGYDGKAPYYRYRYSYNDNYLMSGNAGEAGEIKTVVVRSLKDMDTTIKIGRGGAGGVKNSGADGMPGSATSMGNVIKAEGGAGGKGSIIGKTEKLPAYESDKYAEEKACWNSVHVTKDTAISATCANYEANGYKYFKSTGNMEGKISTLKDLATNLFKYIKPETVSDPYTEKFNEQGKGGLGGGTIHKCWAGQFIVWFEGQILTKTSIFPRNSSGKYKNFAGEWKNTPGDAPYVMPESGKCYDSSGANDDYEITPAGSGVDGALMIKW